MVRGHEMGKREGEGKGGRGVASKAAGSFAFLDHGAIVPRLNALVCISPLRRLLASISWYLDRDGETRQRVRQTWFNGPVPLK